MAVLVLRICPRLLPSLYFSFLCRDISINVFFYLSAIVLALPKLPVFVRLNSSAHFRSCNGRSQLCCIYICILIQPPVPHYKLPRAFARRNSSCAAVLPAPDEALVIVLLERLEVRLLCLSSSESSASSTKSPTLISWPVLTRTLATLRVCLMARYRLRWPSILQRCRGCGAMALEAACCAATGQGGIHDRL